MSNIIELDLNVIENYLDGKEWQALTNYLNEKFRISINDNTGQPKPLPVTEAIIKNVSVILNKVNLCKCRNEENITLTKEVFKSLRNSVVCNQAGQDLVRQDPCILSSTKSIFDNFLDLNSSNIEECIKMGLQFLSNLVTKNAGNGIQVWNIFNDVVLKLYKMPNYSYHTAAVLYNIIYLNNELIKSYENVFEHTIELYTAANPNEYDMLLLELFVQNSLFSKVYPSYEPLHRITVLAFLTESELLNKDNSFPLAVVLALSKEFKMKSDCILKTIADYIDQIEPEEVILLLEILAKLSSHEQHCKYLQSDKGLLINSAFLLKSIHSLGKESQNSFTAVSKLSEVTSTNSSLNKDPSFGFKANLVRLLGNLCWKHRENQDEVRELDCIPLLLDCCNIDARNPFIIQWIIFAVRNLCENNDENQAFIAAMNRQGVVDSATLNQMGLSLHDDGTNKIGILPLDSLKK